MARHPKQKTLYEVTGKVFCKPNIKSKLAQWQSKRVKKKLLLEQTKELPANEHIKGIIGFSPNRRPIERLLEKYVRPIVMAMPKSVLAITALVIILLLSIAAKTALVDKKQVLGRLDGETSVIETEKGANQVNLLTNQGRIDKLSSSPAVKAATKTVKTPEPSAKPAGDNVVVIVQYSKRRDLEPVKQYFAENGIGTVIREINGTFFLITKQRFSTLRTQGSEGYLVMQKIKKVGVNYKSPLGYETFATHLFQDAYGMKISN